jgi:hypothetical protein
LRGEDPEALALSRERQNWLGKTGATRAFDEFRQALLARNHAAVISHLGPATRAILDRAAANASVNPAVLVAKGHVDGLALPGVDEPLRFFAEPGRMTVVEEGQFDPGRKRARLTVKPAAGGSVEVQALFTETGWRIELVRMMETPGT